MKANYGNIRYPFHKLKEGESVLTAYPELREVPIFHETEKMLMVTEIDESGNEVKNKKLCTLDGLDNEFIMRYIILMYSIGSPAIENYPQIGRRKTWVLKELGVIPDSKNMYEKNINSVLMNKNRLVLQKISYFLTLQQPQEWGIWLKSQDDLQNILATPMPDDPNKALNRTKVIEALKDQIASCRAKLLEYDTSRLIEMELNEFMAYTTLGIRPEERVMMDLKAVEPKNAKADTLYPEVGN